MKRSSSPLPEPSVCPLPLRAALAGIVILSPLAAQTVHVWDGGEIGEGQNIGFGPNWDSDTVPTSTASASDTARWDGTVAGNLSLTNSGTFGGGVNTSGVNLDITSGQTGSLSISGGTIRTNGIAVAGGAGAVSLPTIQIGGRTTVTSHTIANDSANELFMGALTKGGNSNRNITFTGAGDIRIAGQIDPGATGTFVLTKTGSGTLFLDGGAHANNDSTLTIQSGAVRLSNGGALGTPGNGTTLSGAGNTGRLEFTGGITVAENITINARGASGGTFGDHLVNVSGDNVLTGALNWTTGGINYGVRSDAGKLTISGNVNPDGAAKDLYVGGAGEVEFTGSIGNTQTGAFALIKNDEGTLTLSGSNTYTGATSVNGGTLLVDGTLGDSSVSVSSGGFLGGSGTIAGGITVAGGGTVAPGNSTGILSTGDISFEEFSILGIEIDGATPGAGYDQLRVSGSVTLAGLLSVTMGYTPAVGELFFILVNDGDDAIDGVFSNAPVDGGSYTLGGQAFLISYSGDSGSGSFTGGNDIVLMAIPEPAAALLGGMGLLALLRRRREM